MAENNIAGRPLMVVEDDPLIGLLVCEILADEGFVVEGPFVSTADALKALAGVRPSAAMLDVNLLDGKSYRVAEALAQLQVPYAFVSSYGPDHPETLKPVACLQKPASREALIALALRLVRV